MKKHFNPFKRFMAQRGRLGKTIDKMALSLHRAYENLDYNVYRNGEYTVLRKLAKQDRSINTIFDVGANKGKWSRMAAGFFPGTKLHAFEIVPQTFEVLDKNCQDYPNVHCYNQGLSDESGNLAYYYSPEADGLSTCVPNFMEAFHQLKVNPVESHVMRGDDFCKEQGIESIDLLKIDVEGYEHKVLEGFSEMLRSGKIKIVQFEYGYVNIETHFLLKDFYDLLGQYDMKIGKIYPGYVEFKPYSFKDENFYGPNYLAVQASSEALIHFLGQTVR